MAARGEAGEGGGEDLALTGGLAGEVGGLEALADLGIAAERAGAAAGDVAEDQVEEAFGCGELSGIGVKGRCWGGGRGGFEAGSEGLEAAGVGVRGEEVGGGVAGGQDEGLAAGRCAGVPDAGGARVGCGG